MTKERWKPVKGYEHYIVSTHGRCKNLRTGRFVGRKRKDKYIQVGLRDFKKRIDKGMHQLVCQAFKPNPKPCCKRPSIIDHIDENPSNNRLRNLRWLSRAKNKMRSSRNKGYFKSGKKFIPRITVNGKTIVFTACKTEK